MEIRSLSKGSSQRREVLHLSISETTRARIRALADKHGYHPSPEISRRASRRWRTGESRGMIVAVVTEEPLDTVLPDTAEVIRVSVERARERGYKRIGVVYLREPVSCWTVKCGISALALMKPLP